MTSFYNFFFFLVWGLEALIKLSHYYIVVYVVKRTAYVKVQEYVVGA